eukprot:5666359-Prymnesium_polylepis.1
MLGGRPLAERGSPDISITYVGRGLLCPRGTSWQASLGRVCPCECVLQSAERGAEHALLVFGALPLATSELRKS